LRQTVNGNQTNYTLDLNNDLAQVLSDRSNTRLYGPSTGSGGRIAQQNIVGRQYSGSFRGRGYGDPGNSGAGNLTAYGRLYQAHG